MPDPVTLEGLHPLEYEHPFDAKALDALEKTPGLNTVVRQFSKHAIERFWTIQYTGSYLRATQETHPAIFAILDKVCMTINLPQRPDFYIRWDYSINSFTFGVEHPIIVVNSGAIDFLDEAELLWLLGHEVGHIKSRHVLYHQTAMFLPCLADFLGELTLNIGSLLSKPLEWALLQWSRMSEFTADRAGILACQDLNVAAGALMKMAEMPKKYSGGVPIESFLCQSRDFERLDYDILNKAVKFVSIVNSTHPWTVMRAAELLRWVESGEYDKVVRRETMDRIGKQSTGENQCSCRVCGYRLEADASFCSWCGANLKGETAIS